MKPFIAAVTGALLLLAAPALASLPITVTPPAGASGTTFVISFSTPHAAAAHALHVSASASASQVKAHDCVPKLDFYNPKSVSAHLRLKFTFTPTSSEALCSGRWTVTVKDTASGKTLLSGGHFALS